MKKIVCCLLLALTLSVLTQPQVLESLAGAVRGLLPGAETEQKQEQSFAHQMGGATVSDTLEVTLYYRYGQTRTLGAQRDQLDITREETVARSIVERLVEGPDDEHDRLSGVFAPGTQVISVTGEGTTAFVTLSRAFLGAPQGAPADWEDLEQWQDEAALRRTLAVQSIALALTEDGRYQRVQVLVANTDDDMPERIPLAWFDRTQTSMATVLGACARDEEALLTPGRAMQLILGAWQARDWETLYAMTAADEGGQAMTLTAFESLMRERDISLLSWQATEGTVSPDGQRATVVLDAQLRAANGGDADIQRESVPLVRVQDNWTMTMDTLTSLMIRD